MINRKTDKCADDINLEGKIIAVTLICAKAIRFY